MGKINRIWRKNPSTQIFLALCGKATRNYFRSNDETMERK